MLFLTTLMVMLIGACAYAVSPSLRDAFRGDPQQSSGEAASPTPRRPVPQPESLEGVLVRQLAEGLITWDQYLGAVELLAARDEERHPLAIPPELGDGG